MQAVCQLLHRESREVVGEIPGDPSRFLQTSQEVNINGLIVVWENAEDKWSLTAAFAIRGSIGPTFSSKPWSCHLI